MRAKADELFMYLAFRFHHTQPDIKTTNIVFDSLFELENENGAIGIDYRVMSAKPHFHNADHLLFKQAQLDLALTKASVFVTANATLHQQLKTLGAAMVIHPLTWIDYVMAAMGKTGKVDIMQFMKEFARENKEILDIQQTLPPEVDPKVLDKDPYMSYKYKMDGYKMDALVPGMRSSDWYNKGKIPAQYRTGESPDVPKEVFERQAEVAKRKAVIDAKRDDLLRELEASKDANQPALQPSADSASVRAELQSYYRFLTSCKGSLRQTLHADAILALINQDKINVSTLEVSDPSVVYDCWLVCDSC